METANSIFLIEDDGIDIMTVQRAFKDLQISNPLEVFTNAETAFAYLQNATTLPGLILLDINMPRMNGLELLALLKSHPELRRIPVVILTTSDQDEDKYRAYQLSAAGYMLKPLEYIVFLQIMQTIHQYWSASE